MKKRKVAVLGATGAVGQRFVQLLDGHPWFTVTALTGSERTVGGAYDQGCRWVLPGEMPAWAGDLPVLPSEPGIDAEIVFSALPSELAQTVELDFAAAGHQVFSNASAHRMAVDVPLLIPEVNPDHIMLVEQQRQQRGWSGCIVTNCNCTATGVTVSLKPLLDSFGLQRVFVVSMQAISGAGYPGVAALDLADNVVPYIAGEEDKLEVEPLKILGRYDGERVASADIGISAHCNRVAVSDGHVVCVTAEFGQLASAVEVIAVMESFAPSQAVRELPSSPPNALRVRLESDRPQPRRDRESGGGMTTVVGRVRGDSLLHVRYVVLSHNTIKGAAGGSLQNAELLLSQGLV